MIFSCDLLYLLEPNTRDQRKDLESKVEKQIDSFLLTALHKTYPHSLLFSTENYLVHVQNQV